jgi:glucose-1-phosphate thymidylyltransferase
MMIYSGAAMSKVVGIIPAAGIGSRLFPYNGGKELLPVGSQLISVDGKEEERPKIVSQYVIEAMAEAGVEHIIIVTRPTKHSLMGLHLDGSQYGVHISYIIQHPVSMAHSIDLAYDWVKSSTVVMGMPDTIVLPNNCIKQLLEHHREDGAELSLGLFPTDKPHKFGMIKTGTDGGITYHQDKPGRTDAKAMWGLAAWEPSFTQLLHDETRKAPASGKEMALGDVFDAMMQQGKICKAYPITEGKYYDIGTYDDYKRAMLEL